MVGVVAGKGWAWGWAAGPLLVVAVGKAGNIDGAEEGKALDRKAGKSPVEGRPAAGKGDGVWRAGAPAAGWEAAAAGWAGIAIIAWLSSAGSSGVEESAGRVCGREGGEQSDGV